MVVLRAITGSRLYNTHDETSDTDYVTVYLSSVKEYLLGTEKESGQNGEESSYDIKFFIRLCSNCNLNVLPVLWSPSFEVKDAYYGEMIVNNRNTFLSKRLFAAGTGYAMRCLKEAQESDRPTGKLGEKRKALIEKHGYDTKAAMHAMRLVRMMQDYLEEPELGLQVVRKDREYLLAIKNGKCPLQEVAAEIKDTMKYIDEHAAKCKLPDVPDREYADSLILEIMKTCISENIYETGMWR